MQRWWTRRGSTFRFFLAQGIVLAALVALACRFWLGSSWPVAYLVGINFGTLIVYLYDKTASGRQWLRVPERVLHLHALVGGSPAAIVSQAAFRHKTVKRSFRTWFWAIVILQAVLLGAWLKYESGR